MFLPDHEKICFNWALHSPEYFSKIKKEYFQDADIQMLYSIASEFYDKYQTCPGDNQMVQLVKFKGIDDKLPESIVKSVYDANIRQHDRAFYDELMQFWIKVKNFEYSTINLIQYAKTAKLTPENIDTVIHTAKGIFDNSASVDFDFDEGLDFFDAESHNQEAEPSYPTGYQFVDAALDGGYTEGSLIVFAGQPKIGKSIWLCNMSANAVLLGYNTLYITLEMKPRRIIRRIGANILDIPISQYKQQANDAAFIKKKLQSLHMSSLHHPGAFKIKEFPTSAASVPDVEAYIKRLEELRNIKYKIIVIDYLNIMMNWRNPKSDNLYLKIKCIAEDLRAMAIRNKWIIVSATQFNKEGWDSTDPTMSMISESSGLVATVDGMFGITFYKDYFLTALAVRESETQETKQRFGIDFTKMRITQDKLYSPTNS